MKQITPSNMENKIIWKLKVRLSGFIVTFFQHIEVCAVFSSISSLLYLKNKSIACQHNTAGSTIASPLEGQGFTSLTETWACVQCWHCSRGLGDVSAQLELHSDETPGQGHCCPSVGTTWVKGNSSTAIFSVVGHKHGGFKKYLLLKNLL